MCESNWAKRKQQEMEKKTKKAMAKEVAAAAAAAEKQDVKAKPNDRVYHTTSGGTMYMSLDVAGGGMCGLLVVIALWMISTGIPYAVAFAAVNGELTDEMQEFVQYLRGIIVDMSDGRLQLKEGEESASFEDVVDNPGHKIETKGMWEKVTLASYGYLGGFAMELVAEFFRLDGFRIVRAGEDGLVVPCDCKGEALSENDVRLVLFDGCGHFKALVPMEAMSLVSPKALRRGVLDQFTMRATYIE